MQLKQTFAILLYLLVWLFKSNETILPSQKETTLLLITMSNTGNCSHPDFSVNLCLLTGFTSDNSSVYQAVVLSTSVIIALSTPVAVTGNALVLAAVWRNPSLRTPSYIILCGLAFTDLCTGLLTHPFYVASRLICWREVRGYNQLSTLPIHAEVITNSIAAGCSTYFTALTLILMAFLSIERWLHMTRRSMITVRRSYCMVAISSFLLIPIAVLYVQECYIVSSAIILVVLLFSLTATSICYFKVFRNIRHHQQQVQTNESSQNFGQPAIDLAKYKKSVVTILYVLGVSYFSYLPCLVIPVLIIAFNSISNESQTFFMVLFMFLYMSSSLNPVIYIWRMTDLRNGVKTLLTKCFCKQ